VDVEIELTDLAEDPGHFVRRAGAGAQIVITIQGRAVAALGPTSDRARPALHSRHEQSDLPADPAD
jgi:antitoxin (DNA-binding transcriptional repressor) of toxin-antitoxin stability system